MACLLVAAFESPIGHSMQGFVMRHEIQWCPGADFPILLQSEMREGEDGPRRGTTQRRYYAVPTPGAEPASQDQPMKPTPDNYPG